MTWEEWKAEQYFRFCERHAIQTADDVFDRREFDYRHPLRGARDSYGWRSLLGTSYLGATTAENGRSALDVAMGGTGPAGL